MINTSSLVNSSTELEHTHTLVSLARALPNDKAIATPFKDQGYLIVVLQTNMQSLSSLWSS